VRELRNENTSHRTRWTIDVFLSKVPAVRMSDMLQLVAVMLKVVQDANHLLITATS